MKTYMFIIIMIIVVTLGYLAYIYIKFPDFKPRVSIVEIYSNNLNEKLFIKKKVWGLVGGNQVIVISKTPNENFEPNENREYVFEGLPSFFYNFENDTLNIYVDHKSKVPTEMVTNIKINQIVLTNPEMMNLYDNYENKGLKKIN